MSTARGNRWMAFAFVALILGGPRAATAGVTSILLTSDPGDYIGGGQTQIFTSADGSFFAQSYGNGSNVTISFNTPTFDHWWHLNFAAADQQALVVGPYEGAIRVISQQAGQPGLDVYGDGRGCNMLTGRFDVLELILNGDQVMSFRAAFEQHCEGATQALRGEVRFNATVPIQLTAPSTASVLENRNLSFQVSASDTEGRHVILSAFELPFGASFVDHGNNTGTFSWTPLSSQAGVYRVRIQGANGVAVETTYVRITVLLTPPTNDDFDAAFPITGVPFVHTQPTATATSAPDDPFCSGNKASVWFSYTPTQSGRVEFNTFGSDYDTTLSAWSDARGNLSQLACNDNANGLQSRIRFDAVAGATYYIMAGAFFFSSGGALTLNAVPGPPPFTMQFTFDRFSSVQPSTGTVTINGTAICSGPSFVQVSGAVRQARAGNELAGYFNAFVQCDGVTVWTAPVLYSTGLFSGRAAALFTAGRAEATASAYAFDPVEGTSISRNAAASITLRGGR